MDTYEKKYNAALEKEIRRYLLEEHDRDTTVGDVARHFAKWQKQHDAELIEIAYNDGIAIGMTKQKEQMMKEAVEGRIGLLGFHNAVYIKEPKWTNIIDMFNEGDTVCIIIVKE